MKGKAVFSVRNSHNQGFSLVEVLVCISILAIICIPIFRGFQFSAYNNNEAHHVQNVTAYAQQVMESVKTMRIDAENPAAAAVQLEQVLGNTGTGALLPADLDAQEDALLGTVLNNFSYLFTPITYDLEDITIEGRVYNMNVLLDPIPYSQVSARADAIAPANDVNTLMSSRVEDVDGMKFPVISDEIHRHEEVVFGWYDYPSGSSYDGYPAILNTLQAMAREQHRELWTQKDIYARLVKTIQATIYPINTGGVTTAIEVYCDVEYAVTHDNGKTVQKSYNVYKGTFDLDCGGTPGETVHDSYSGWKNGGRIYISAMAFLQRKLNDTTPVRKRINNVEINVKQHPATGDTYTRLHNLDVFLIRSFYPNESVAPGEPVVRSENFDRVTVNGTDYYDGFDGSVLPGERIFGNINLHTNLKGVLVDGALQEADREETVGGDRTTLRCYDVTVTLTDPDTAEIAAQIQSTKKVM